MGYGNPDLDQISDNALLGELVHRINRRTEGLCSYCLKPLQRAPGCARHTEHMKTSISTEKQRRGLAALEEVRQVLK